MKRSELEDKNLSELKKIAKSSKLKGYSKFRKSDIPELIDLILNLKVSKKPKRSVSKKPKRSVSKKPKRSVSKKPKRSVSKKPKRSVSKKPKRSVSKKPKRSVSNIVLPGYTKKISNMKIKELREYASRINLKGYSKLNKVDLIVFITGNKQEDKQGDKQGDNQGDKQKTPEKYKLPLSKEDVKSLKKKEMIQILKDNGITIGLPQKRSELMLLLQQNKCSPIDKKYCDNDEVCDIRNNICMSPEFSKRGLIKIKLDGKEIIGTKQAIDKIKEQIKKKRVQPQVLNEDVGMDIIDIMDDDKADDPLDNIILDSDKDELDNDKDELDIIDVDGIFDISDDYIDLNDMDIEKSLEEIEVLDKNEKTEMLGDVQKEVLKCLGMLS